MGSIMVLSVITNTTISAHGQTISLWSSNLSLRGQFTLVIFIICITSNTEPSDITMRTKRRRQSCASVRWSSSSSVLHQTRNHQTLQCGQREGDSLVPVYVGHLHHLYYIKHGTIRHYNADKEK